MNCKYRPNTGFIVCVELLMVDGEDASLHPTVESGFATQHETLLTIVRGLLKLMELRTEFFRVPYSSGYNVRNVRVSGQTDIQTDGGTDGRTDARKDTQTNRRQPDNIRRS